MALSEEKRYKLLFLDALEPFMDFLPVGKLPENHSGIRLE